jgi:hypothetical protein
MIKKIFIGLALITAASVAIVFIYRHAIIQYSAERLIRSNLPSYVRLEKVRFDFSANKIILENFKVLNPPGFSYPSLIEIGSISCRYRMKGVGIPEGLEISDILIKRFNITVERLRDGGINLTEMGSLTKSAPSGEPLIPNPGAPIPKEGNEALRPEDRSFHSSERNPAPSIRGIKAAVLGRRDNASGGKKLSDVIKLPPSFGVKDARIDFMDRADFYDKPHLITIDNVEGDVSIRFNDYYTQISSLAFTLRGNLNGASNEVIKWVGALNPATPKITMSNRFAVENLDIIAFEPYYDKFSPFIFKRGKFSGTLVFDFNNGDIGSTNEIRLSNILFWVKPGYENAQMWETNVQDLMRYFTTASGDIVFDFKVKGDMAKPEFYLGPISKRAITSMAIDKISSYAVDAVTKQAGGAAEQIDKAKEYIDLFRGLINKK